MSTPHCYAPTRHKRTRARTRGLTQIACVYSLTKAGETPCLLFGRSVQYTRPRALSQLSYRSNDRAWNVNHMEPHTRDGRHQDALVDCHACGARMQAENLDDHLSLQCPKRIYRCHYCEHYVGKYEEVKKNHYPKCEGFPLPCCNPHCSLGSVPRTEYADHMRFEYRDLVS